MNIDVEILNENEQIKLYNVYKELFTMTKWDLSQAWESHSTFEN